MHTSSYSPATWPANGQWQRNFNPLPKTIIDNTQQKGFYSINNKSVPNVLKNNHSIGIFSSTYNLDQDLKKDLGINNSYTSNIKKPIIDAKTKETYLDTIARLLIGRDINSVKNIYPNTRVVIRDGTNLVGVHNLDRERINVETKNNIIVKTLGFY